MPHDFVQCSPPVLGVTIGDPARTDDVQLMSRREASWLLSEKRDKTSGTCSGKLIRSMTDDRSLASRLATDESPSSR